MDTSQLARNIEAAAHRMREAAVKGLTELAEEVGEEAAGLAPRDGGDLARSKVVVVDASTLTATVAFGRGLPDDYVVAVHEDMTAQHDDGEAKFMEKPFQRARVRGAQTIGRAVQRAL